MSMFSQTAEYALRAIVCLAAHKGEPLATAQIAGSTLVPPGYLSKVLQALGRAGLVTSQRGLHGGFKLTRPAEDIRVLEVIDAVDPVARITRCPLDLKAHGERLCALHKRLDEAIAHIQGVLSRSTIADLLLDPTSSRPLCAIDPPRARRSAR